MRRASGGRHCRAACRRRSVAPAGGASAGARARWPATLGEGRSRALFTLSLAVFSLEFLLPALVGLLPGGAWLTQTGPLLRGAVVLGALCLACLGQREVLR